MLVKYTCFTVLLLCWCGYCSHYYNYYYYNYYYYYYYHHHHYHYCVCVCCSQLHLSCSARRLHRQTLHFRCVAARQLGRERFLCDVEPAAVGVTWYPAQTAVTQCHARRQQSAEEFASCTGCQQNVRRFVSLTYLLCDFLCL